MQEKLKALEELLTVVHRLRAPGGCPWDQEQTLADMSRYILEEASEVGDAVHASDGQPSDAVCEELGDLLMNVFLAARIAEESGKFSLREVADRIAAKLIHRHPHVFGDAQITDVDAVLEQWNAIKEAEREAVGGKSSCLDGVPNHLPPLVRAFELGRKAAKVGFDWPGAEGAFRKVEEELGEVRSRMSNAGEENTELQAELGDLLFAVVNLCRKLDVRPEDALRDTLAKFRLRFRVIETRLPDLQNASLDEMERIWQEAKVKSRAEASPLPPSGTAEETA